MNELEEYNNFVKYINPTKANSIYCLTLSQTINFSSMSKIVANLALSKEEQSLLSKESSTVKEFADESLATLWSKKNKTPKGVKYEQK